MKVMLVNGSPRKNGCTNRALEEVKAQLQKEGIDSEIFWIGTKVQSCIACRQCKKTGKCVFDDILTSFVEKAKDSDGFIFGTPVYYGGPAGGIQSFMDRLFFSSGRYLTNKPVSVVTSCRRGGASETFARLNMYAMMSNCPVVTSQYWNQVHGGEREDVEKDLEGLQTMRTLARNMAWMLKCIEAGKKAGIPLPKHEPWIPTNFIR